MNFSDFLPDKILVESCLLLKTDGFVSRLLSEVSMKKKYISFVSFKVRNVD